jgi:hypothetical protein
MEWTEAQNGESYPITTSPAAGTDAIRVKSIADVVTLYRRKREAKSLGTDGQPCTRETQGLLHRRPVRDLTIRHIGKEANELEDLTAGLRSGEEVTAAYDHHRRGVYPQLVLHALRAFPEPVVADACGLPMRTIKGLGGGRSPKTATLRSLVSGLAKLCRAALGDAQLDGVAALAALVTWRDRPTEKPTCPNCGRSPSDRPHLLQPGLQAGRIPGTTAIRTLARGVCGSFHRIAYQRPSPSLAQVTRCLRRQLQDEAITHRRGTGLRLGHRVACVRRHKQCPACKHRSFGTSGFAGTRLSCSGTDSA